MEDNEVRNLDGVPRENTHNPHHQALREVQSYIDDLEQQLAASISADYLKAEVEAARADERDRLFWEKPELVQDDLRRKIAEAKIDGLHAAIKSISEYPGSSIWSRGILRYPISRLLAAQFMSRLMGLQWELRKDTGALN